MRKIAKSLLLILGVLLVVEALETALMVWAFRTHSPRVLDLIKRFNKLTNPIWVRFAGRSGHLANVHHVGRRSGTPYVTPVMAHRSDDDIVIPLPYGTDVDWLQNLLTSGQGVMDLDGQTFTVDHPAAVGMDDVIGMLPTSMERIVRSYRTRDAVRLRVSRVATPVSA